MSLKENVTAYLEAYKIFKETKQGSYTVTQLRNKIKPLHYQLEKNVGRELALQYIEKQDPCGLLCSVSNLSHSIVSMVKECYKEKKKYTSFDEAITYTYLKEYNDDQEWLDEWCKFREFMNLIERFEYYKKAKDRITTFKQLIDEKWVVRMQNAFNNVDLNSLNSNEKELIRHISYFTAMLLNKVKTTESFFLSLIEKAIDAQLIFSLYTAFKYTGTSTLLSAIKPKYDTLLNRSLGYQLLKIAKVPVQKEKTWQITIAIDSEEHKHKLILTSSSPSNSVYSLLLEENYSRSFFPPKQGHKNKITDDLPLDCTADKIITYFNKIAKHLNWTLKQDSLSVKYGTPEQETKLKNYINNIKPIPTSKADRKAKQIKLLETYIADKTDSFVSEETRALTKKLPSNLPIELVEKVLLKNGASALFSHAHNLKITYIEALYKVVSQFIKKEEYISKLSLHFVRIAIEKYNTDKNDKTFKIALKYLAHIHKFIQAKYDKRDFEKLNPKIDNGIAEICYTLLSSQRVISKILIEDELNSNEGIIFHNFFVYPLVFMDDGRLLEVSKYQIAGLQNNFDIYRYGAPIFHWKEKTNVFKAYEYITDVLLEKTASSLASKWLSQFNITLEPNTSWYLEITVGSDPKENIPSFSKEFAQISLSNITNKYPQFYYQKVTNSESLEKIKTLTDFKEAITKVNEWAKKEQIILYWQKAKINFVIHPIKTMKVPKGLKKEIKNWVLTHIE